MTIKDKNEKTPFDLAKVNEIKILLSSKDI